MGGPPRWAGSTISGGRIRSLNSRKVGATDAVLLTEGRNGNVVEKGNGQMRTRVDEKTTRSADHLPEIRAWREVGWIFRDGDAIAIERRGDSTRVRTARVCHLRDE